MTTPHFNRSAQIAKVAVQNFFSLLKHNALLQAQGLDVVDCIKSYLPLDKAEELQSLYDASFERARSTVRASEQSLDDLILRITRLSATPEYQEAFHQGIRDVQDYLARNEPPLHSL